MSACKFNPTEAKKLYEEAGGYKGPADHGGTTATADTSRGPTPRCNSIKNTLGLECVTKVTP